MNKEMSNFPSAEGGPAQEMTRAGQEPVSETVTEAGSYEEMAEALEKNRERDERESKEKAQRIRKELFGGKIDPEDEGGERKGDEGDEDDNRNEGRRSSEGSESREFGEHQMIVASSDKEKVKEVLDGERGGLRIPSENERYREEGKKDEKGGGAPEEFLVSIMNPWNEEEPADKDTIIKAALRLKYYGIAFRYCRKPDGAP